MERFDKLIATYQDFPVAGVLFRDFSPLLFNPEVRSLIIDQFENFAKEQNTTVIVGIDARGFILASMLAERMRLPLVMIRKGGKLPDYAVLKKSYAYEYASGIVTISKESIRSWDRVLVMDDMLATGGTMAAAIELVKEAGAAKVCGAVMMELQGMHGRAKIGAHNIFAARSYEN